MEDVMEGKRFKIINSRWNQSSIVTKAVLHPAVVWDAIRRHHWEVVMKDRFIPKHVLHELCSMLECMVVNFEYLILQKALSVDLHCAVKMIKLEDSEVTKLLDVNQISAVDVQRLLVEAYNRSDAILMLSTITAAQSSEVDLSTIIPAVIDQYFSFEQSVIREWDSGSTKVSSVLRLLLLNYVQPSTNGVLAGYIPRNWLSQTFAKGWGTSTAIMEAAKRLSWDKV